jgi:hypothetical protein
MRSSSGIELVNVPTAAATNSNQRIAATLRGGTGAGSGGGAGRRAMVARLVKARAWTRGPADLCAVVAAALDELEVILDAHERLRVAVVVSRSY